jgi:hypothetical protein
VSDNRHISATQESSADVIEFPQDKTQRQHTRGIFAWLDQVLDDTELQHPDFKVAYVIAQHINRKSGEAWPSAETIAERARISKPSAIAGRRRLEQRGHIEMSGGRAGRGHSHHCRLIAKGHGADLFEDGKKSKPDAEKVKTDPVKGHSGDLNHFNNNLRTSAPSSAPPAGARSSELETAERERQVLIELRELIPLQHPSQFEQVRAEYRALRLTVPSSEILDRAAFAIGENNLLHFLITQRTGYMNGGGVTQLSS